MKGETMEELEKMWLKLFAQTTARQRVSEQIKHLRFEIDSNGVKKVKEYYRSNFGCPEYYSALIEYIQKNPKPDVSKVKAGQ
jgi:hypothetical protein